MGAMMKISSIVFLIIAIMPLAVAAQDITFAPPVYLGTSQSHPDAITTSDFDSDGDIDLAIAQTTYPHIVASIYKNNGLGMFHWYSDCPISGLPVSISAGDIDNDGDMDIACAMYSADSVCVLRNLGSGDFLLYGTYGTDQNARGACFADLDRDGYNDLCICNELGRNVQIRRNLGNGVFLPPSSYYSCYNPETINAADLDNDNDIDIVVSSTDSISVLRNNGTGRLQATEMYDAGIGSCFSACLADLNNDDYLDIATINYGADNVVVLLNNGDGTFQDADIYSVLADGPVSITSSDFDNDGLIDLAVSCENERLFFVMKNLGNRLFRTDYYLELAGISTALCSGDFDGDNDSDIAATIDYHDTLCILINTTEPSDISDDIPEFSNKAITFRGNYPNPFNSSTIIRYDLGQPSIVKIEIFDVLGRLIRPVCNAYQETGNHEVRWNGDSLRSGVYFCRIQTAKYSTSRKITLLR
jgi:hypothetical protein